MKICFLTTGHDPLDDRIFYHMAASLYAYGHDILIVNSMSESREVVEGNKLNCFDGEILPKREKTK